MQRLFIRHHRTRAALAAAWLLFGLLAGCASTIPVPRDAEVSGLPLMLRVTQAAASDQAEQSLLVVQAEQTGGTRWSLLDALGAPRARQILQDGQWRNDGFLPPNAPASALFSALIFAWTPPALLAARYGAANVQIGADTRALSGQGRLLLTVITTGPQRWELTLADQTRWRVAPLEAAP